MPSHDMKTMIGTLSDLIEACNAKHGMPGDRPKLHPPAGDDAIRAFEARIGRKFPPSYVEMLHVTNGIEKYRDVWTLIGVSGAHTDGALKDIEQTVKFYLKAWEPKFGPATDPKIRAFEKDMDLTKKTEDEAGLYLPNKFHFGTDFAGGLLYFLPESGAKRVELKVVHRKQTRAIQRVFASFPEMLRHHISMFEKELAAQ